MTDHTVMPQLSPGFRIRVFKSTAGEHHYIVAPPKSTDHIVYGELVHAAKVTWKPGGQLAFVLRLTMLEKKARSEGTAR